MKTLRAIPIIVALIAFCVTGGAMAENESPSVQVTQAQPADSHAAMLDEFRGLHADMKKQGRDMRAQIQATHHTLHMSLLTIICLLGTGIIALAGLLWHSRPGTPSTPDLAFLIPLLCSAALTIKTAIVAFA